MFTSASACRLVLLSVLSTGRYFLDVNTGERIHGGGRQLRQLRGRRPLAVCAHHGGKLSHGRRPFFHGEAAGETPQKFRLEISVSRSQERLSATCRVCSTRDRCCVGWAVRGRCSASELPPNRLSGDLDLYVEYYWTEVGFLCGLCSRRQRFVSAVVADENI